MIRERRLTIAIIGASTLLAIVAIAVLSALGRPSPDVLDAIAIGGLALLTPSPLSKSSTAER